MSRLYGDSWQETTSGTGSNGLKFGALKLGVDLLSVAGDVDRAIWRVLP
ncbi:hypothetical protein [Haloplanus salinus]|nr:hypothetical protein [Haloplanus salinus]